ncbi:MAG: CRISPR-associated protein Cas4 [Alphaproteobacteria bacterium]|nr:CRISPR-associated protein Cas4 [Alphaproteobacteria bacterium]
MNEDTDSLPISALQHWLFCPRQCALIHVERLWSENRFTAEGRVLHEVADAGGKEKRGAVKTLRAVQIASVRLGLHGVADIVELHGHPPQPLPVEYKRGRPKSHRADEVQLCAQGICLEEMFNCEISEGALFYGQNRRRTKVAFDEELRALTAKTASQARAVMGSGILPRPQYVPARCDACSLFELCRPKELESQRNVQRWLVRSVASSGVPE